MHALLDEPALSARIPVPGAVLAAELAIPAKAPGVVIFADGGANSREDHCLSAVGQGLRHAGIGTLRLELISEGGPESRFDRQISLDVGQLAARLALATLWLGRHPRIHHLGLGYFAMNTGTAGALVSASHLGGQIQAIVSMKGRPDLAESVLEKVDAPTLLMVGGEDRKLARLNRTAFHSLLCDKKLIVIPPAVGLFEETALMDEVCSQAVVWFRRFLAVG